MSAQHTRPPPPNVNPFYIEPGANRHDYFINDEDVEWTDNDFDSDLEELLEHQVPLRGGNEEFSYSARRRRRFDQEHDYYLDDHSRSSWNVRKCLLLSLVVIAFVLIAVSDRGKTEGGGGRYDDEPIHMAKNETYANQTDNDIKTDAQDGDDSHDEIDRDFTNETIVEPSTPRQHPQDDSKGENDDKESSTDENANQQEDESSSDAMTGNEGEKGESNGTTIGDNTEETASRDSASSGDEDGGTSVDDSSTHSHSNSGSQEGKPSDGSPKGESNVNESSSGADDQTTPEDEDIKAKISNGSNGNQNKSNKKGDNGNKETTIHNHDKKNETDKVESTRAPSVKAHHHHHDNKSGHAKDHAKQVSDNDDKSATKSKTVLKHVTSDTKKKEGASKRHHDISKDSNGGSKIQKHKHKTKDDDAPKDNHDNDRGDAKRNVQRQTSIFPANAVESIISL